MCQISPSKSIWSLELIDRLTMRPTRRSPRAKETFVVSRTALLRGCRDCHQLVHCLLTNLCTLQELHCEAPVVRMYLEGVVHAKSNQADDLDFRSLRIKTTRRLIKIRVFHATEPPKEYSVSVSGSPQEEISLLISPLLFVPCAPSDPSSSR